MQGQDRASASHHHRDTFNNLSCERSAGQIQMQQLFVTLDLVSNASEHFSLLLDRHARVADVVPRQIEVLQLPVLP